MALSFFASTHLIAQNTQKVTLHIIETTDIHGSFFPYDFVSRKGTKGSLAQIATYVKRLRRTHGDNVILVDNGDILQGQPVTYYYNYIDTLSAHVAAEMLNYMQYDVVTLGNHDIETGHAVYDRWITQTNASVLGANILRKEDDTTCFPPYKVLIRQGVKVVILGMITPAIPSWLPEQLWSGMRFEDMESAARKWVKIIREKEHPDVLIGLFHSGSAGNLLGGVVENASLDVATRVPGFDVVFMGHDHLKQSTKVTNVLGDSVLIIDPANAARFVADVRIEVTKQNGQIIRKNVQGKLVDVRDLPSDKNFMYKFQTHFEATKNFVSKRIGKMERTISAVDAFFGSSAFVDLIHTLQLDLTGADISFCAPLSPKAEIKEGDIFMSDMFNLYKFENMLYTMRLSGREIKDYLEMSYALWTNQMKSSSEHLLLLHEEGEKKGYFKYPTYNFDSAAGIRYTVDVTRPEGEKITISSMADGTPFDEEKHYKVAINSYRGNGGGELLTKGAGIPKEELASRILYSTPKDLRYYLMKRIEELQSIHPKALHHWKFIPEDWVKIATARDKRLVFHQE